MILVQKSDKPLPGRRPLDRYLTPKWVVEQAYSLLEGEPSTILDPAAGHGVWGKVARGKWPRAVIVGCEIDRDLPNAAGYDEWRAGDFLKDEGAGRFDLIATNPPYYAAEEFVAKGLEFLAFGGRLIYLLRLDFLSSRGRTLGLFARHPPQTVTIIQRPNFEGCGVAQPNNFALYQWQQGWRGETRINWMARSN